LVLLVSGLVLACLPVAAEVIDDEDNLYVGPGDEYTLDGVHTYNVSVMIDFGGTLYVTTYNGSGTTGTLELHGPEIVVLGDIAADGRGFREDEGPGTGSPQGYAGAGAGYGGQGGDSGHGGTGGPPYGGAVTPEILKGSGGCTGAGGADSRPGGHGGGCVLLNGEQVTIEGSVTADGATPVNYDWAPGGGSGGGILIWGGDVVVNGVLSVRGGNGGNGIWGGGGGAGGRIKIFYDTLNTTGSTMVYGGGSGGSGTWPGQAGGTGTYHDGFASDVPDQTTLPTVYALHQNQPNPFTSHTAIRFDLHKPAAVKLQIFDAQGRLVKTLVDEQRPAGRYAMNWSGDGGGRALVPGVYFIRFQAQQFVSTRRVVMIR
jgi:hypothetical protein